MCWARSRKKRALSRAVPAHNGDGLSLLDAQMDLGKEQPLLAAGAESRRLREAEAHLVHGDLHAVDDLFGLLLTAATLGGGVRFGRLLRLRHQLSQPRFRGGAALPRALLVGWEIRLIVEETHQANQRFEGLGHLNEVRVDAREGAAHLVEEG